MRTLYDLLQISPNADHDAVERAYQQRVQEYQPACLAGLGPVSRQAAEQEWEWIQYAYEVLREPQTRAAYDAELAAPALSTFAVPPPVAGAEAAPTSSERSGKDYWRVLYYVSILVAIGGAVLFVWGKLNPGGRR